MRRCQRQTKQLGIIAAAAMLATGCDVASSSAVCDVFPLYTYTAAQQSQAAAELDGRPTLARMITDYGDWRARRRAVCR